MAAHRPLRLADARRGAGLIRPFSAKRINFHSERHDQKDAAGRAQGEPRQKRGLPLLFAHAGRGAPPPGHGEKMRKLSRFARPRAQNTLTRAAVCATLFNIPLLKRWRLIKRCRSLFAESCPPGKHNRSWRPQRRKRGEQAGGGPVKTQAGPCQGTRYFQEESETT